MNQQKAEALALRVVGDMAGSFAMALGHIGDRLGLFRAMAGAGPITSEQLASRTGLNERYVREWLKAMVAAEYLDYERHSGRFVMTPEQAAVLADDDSALSAGGALQFTAPTVLNTPRVMDAFVRGGGVPYAEIGDEIPAAIARFFGPGYKHSLVTEWLAALPGLTDRLAAGIDVADIGCGFGLSTVTMAQAFPRSRFVGLDVDARSIAEARRLGAERGVTNVTWITGPAHDLPRERAYALICTFDCIHDMADPRGALKTIHAALAEDGVYLWSEPNASDDPLENRNPIGKAYACVSPLHCMTVSLAHGGDGLGTAIGERGARELAKEARFSEFDVLPIADAFNQFFALRK